MHNFSYIIEFRLEWTFSCQTVFDALRREASNQHWLNDAMLIRRIWFHNVTYLKGVFSLFNVIVEKNNWSIDV